MFLRFLHWLVLLVYSILLWVSNFVLGLHTPLLTRSRRTLAPMKFQVAHLGLIIDSRYVYVNQISRVCAWAVDCGIKYITIHDWKGQCADQQEAIAMALFHLQTGTPICVRTTNAQFDLDAESFTSKPVPLNSLPSTDPRLVTILITRGEDGHEILVQCARSLALQVPADCMATIDVDRVDAAVRAHPVIRGVPDMDVALEFTPSHSLAGLLPWHLRLTEFISAGHLHEFSRQDFYRCLEKFSHIEQRFGR
eukprot:c10166_g1_i1.p1 GENE.c10166_g1_i1~~c10166_g1_i1.p1  ORF type:complete len:251 (-),score=40.47 c10166_g1_i1:79-831(-)